MDGSTTLVAKVLFIKNLLVREGRAYHGQTMIAAPSTFNQTDDLRLDGISAGFKLNAAGVSIFKS